MTCETKKQQTAKTLELILPSSALRTGLPLRHYLLNAKVRSDFKKPAGKNHPILGNSIFAFAVMLTLFLSTCSPAKAEMSESFVNKIADAIYKAENSKKYPYGIVSVKCISESDCRAICKNTIRNNYRRWLKSDRSLTYLQFLASRYAPVGMGPNSNDPTNLNRHWLSNVQLFLYGGAA